MAELTNKFLNQWGHELLGKCWHEFTSHRAIHDQPTCLKECGATRWDENVANPNYCSDLNAARLVELKVLKLLPDDSYLVYVFIVLQRTKFDGHELSIALLRIDARQRMEACYLAMEKSND